MSDVQKLADTLARHERKLTRGRITLYRTLSAAQSPLSNRQIIDRLPDMDQVTIYRTLELFEAIGITHRIWNGFKSAVELSEAFSAHHHHFECTVCGAVVSFKSDRIEKSLHDLEKELGVSVTRHMVELSGLCAGCRSPRTSRRVDGDLI